MLQTLEAIVIMFIVWQMMIRLRNNIRLTSNAKSEFQEAIDDAKKRLPSTGLFALFKADSSSQQNIEEPEIEFEQTIVVAKGVEKEDVDQ